MSFKTDSPDGPSKMALAWASPGTSRTVTEQAFVAAFSISRSRVIGVELSSAEPMRSSGLVSSAASAGVVSSPPEMSTTAEGWVASRDAAPMDLRPPRLPPDQGGGGRGRPESLQ